MGYTLKGDFETTYGKLAEIYTHIQSFHFNRTTGICTFSYTYWPDKSTADTHTPAYEGDILSKAVSMLGPEIIKYQEDKSPTDILLPHSLKSFAGTVITIEEPVYEYETYIEEIPFVSFDENGDEITKYREVERQKKVQTGIQTVSKNAFDPDIVDFINPFGYEVLKKELLKWFQPQEIIEH